MEKGFEDKTGTQGILEDSRELRGKTEITLARTLVIPKDRLILARVVNFSDRPIRLRTDQGQTFLLPNMIVSVVRMTSLFHWNQPQIQPVSLTHLQLLTNQWRKREVKEDEKWRLELRGDLEGLLEDQREQFLSLVMEYDDIFAKESSDFGKLGLLDFAIDTSDCKPVKQPPRRVPP